MKKVICLILSTLFISNIYSQIIVTSGTGITPQQLVQSTLLGTGVTVSNVKFNNSTGPLVGSMMGTFVTGGVPTNLGISSGLILASGGVTGAIGPNNAYGTTTPTGTTNISDPQLQTLIPGYTINDAAVLEFDFIPLSDTIKFRYVFGSEEYPEYVNSSFNDVFGFFVTGINPNGPAYNNKNIAIIPNTNTAVAINNVNNGYFSGCPTNQTTGPCNNCAYYVNNCGGVSVQYDGLTVVLTAWIVVQPCTQYHIKIAIADAGDTALDSGVFLEANSFSSNAITVTTNYSTPSAIPMAIEGCNNAMIKFNLPYAKADTFWVPIDTVYGTATNGVDFPLIGNTFPIPPGQTSGTLIIMPFMDGINEPVEYVTIKIKSTVCTYDSVTIPILSYQPIVVNSITDTMICQNDNLDASAQLGIISQYGHPPYTYNWQPTTYLSNPNIANPISTPPIGNSMYYTVMVTDSTGCPGDTADMNVIVNQEPSVSFDVNPMPAEGCVPLTLNFTDITFPAVQTYSWNFGDGGTSTIANPTHTYTQVGNYDVSLSVITTDGCQGYIKLFNAAKVYPMPVASFTATPNIAPITNSLISFNSSQSSSNVTNWFWNFGEPASPDNSSNLQNPTHLYLSQGLFGIWLKVTTAHGCSDSTYHEIRIVEDSLVFPNIITPNGDGFNDYFKILNLENYLSNQLIIYNRWGKKVYEKEPYIPDVHKWDGEGLPDGTYYFILRYKGYLNEGEYKGSLTILR